MTSEAAVARLVERLEAEGVPYMFTGALSANLYGVPRATSDADSGCSARVLSSVPVNRYGKLLTPAATPSASRMLRRMK